MCLRGENDVIDSDRTFRQNIFYNRKLNLRVVKIIYKNTRSFHFSIRMLLAKFQVKQNSLQCLVSRVRNSSIAALLAFRKCNFPESIVIRTRIYITLLLLRIKSKGNDLFVRKSPNFQFRGPKNYRQTCNYEILKKKEIHLCNRTWNKE